MRLALPILLLTLLVLGCGKQSRPQPEAPRVASQEKKMERQYNIVERAGGREPLIVTSATFSEDEREALPVAILARLPYRPQPNGLPQAGELDRVGKIEDKLVEQLEKLGAQHVGHITGRGEMKVLFYGRQEVPTSLKVRTSMLKSDSIPLEVRRDPDWSVYRLDFELTKTEVSKAKDDELRRVLAGHGDVHSKPRNVDFAAHFATEKGRTSFMQEIQQRGFTPSAQPLWQDDLGRFWCEIVKNTPVEHSAISPETAYLEEMAARHGGEFDGWACPVTK